MPGTAVGVGGRVGMKNGFMAIPAVAAAGFKLKIQK
jgi:hypothetical protein